MQAELLKRWQRWKLGKDLAEEYKHTYSHAPSARNGAGGCEKHQLVGGCANGMGRGTAVRSGSHYLESSGRGAAEPSSIRSYYSSARKPAPHFLFLAAGRPIHISHR